MHTTKITTYFLNDARYKDHWLFSYTIHTTKITAYSVNIAHYRDNFLVRCTPKYIEQSLIPFTTNMCEDHHTGYFLILLQILLLYATETYHLYITKITKVMNCSLLMKYLTYVYRVLIYDGYCRSTNVSKVWQTECRC